MPCQAPSYLGVSRSGGQRVGGIVVSLTYWVKLDPQGTYQRLRNDQHWKVSSMVVEPTTGTAISMEELVTRIVLWLLH